MSDPLVVSVVAGGPSFRGINHERLPGSIIAVNQSALELKKRADFVVSMDRLWTEHSWAALNQLQIPFYVRWAALKNVSPPWPDWVHPFYCDYTTNIFSETFNGLNGTNSGACALNLAYLMRPQQLFLFGFDMQRPAIGSPYWHQPYAWAPKGGTKHGKYAEWSRQFEQTARDFKRIGCEVINITTSSAITCFKRADPHTLGFTT